MKVEIRQEREGDHKEVFELVKQAFADQEFSDHREHHLVERLRSTTAFIPELSLVAVCEGRIAGHILLTKVEIVDDNVVYGSLALAPVSVIPSMQGKGIGSQLIRYAHKQAKLLGYESVIVLGHEYYYPQFGYRPLSTFGIHLPFDTPNENCMGIELTTNALSNVKGMVRYPKEFFE